MRQNTDIRAMYGRKVEKKHCQCLCDDGEFESLMRFRDVFPQCNGSKMADLKLYMMRIEPNGEPSPPGGDTGPG